MLRQRSCQNQCIDNRYHDQDNDMPQLHRHSKPSFIGKGTERIDCRMDENAGEQAAAAVKNRDQQKTDCDCKDDLTQIACQIHTAAVEQIDNVPNAESHTGNDNG